MIRINCFIKVNSGAHEEVLAAAKALTQLSLKEEGCKAYDIFQSETRPDVMMICETWVDNEALARHQSTKDFELYVGIMRSGATLSTDKIMF